MANRTLLVWVVLLLLATLPVLAAEDTSTGLQLAPLAEDFSASGTSRILAFACSPAQTALTIKNTGNVPSAYDFIAEGEAKNWVQFEPQSLVLKPGETATVQEYLDVPCDAEDSFVDITIAADEQELTLGQDIIVQTPNDIVLKPLAYAHTILPCGEATFSLVLLNPAEFTETYALKVTDAPAETSLSDESITLLPHTNETITVAVRPKDCTLSGEFSPLLTVKTKKTRLQAELDLFLRINNSDIAKVAEGVDAIKASLAAQEAEIEIANTGDRTTTYLLNTKGAKWVAVKPEQITISAHDTKKAKLVLQPPAGTTSGRYPVTIVARVEATGKEYSKKIAIKLGEPGLVDKLFTDYLAFTIAGIVVIIALIILIWWVVKKYRSPEFQAKLAERRAAREQARQERIAQRLARKEEQRKQREEAEKRREDAERRRAEQEAREEERQERVLERERVKAQRAYERELRKEHLVIPKDDIIGGALKAGKRIWKLALLVLIIILVLLGTTFQNALVQNTQAVLAGIVILAIIFILHRIRRSKRARGRWKLALANEDLMMKTGWRTSLSTLTFTLRNVVEKLRVIVQRTRPSIAPPGEAYGAFTITPNISPDVVARATLTFSVRKSWLARNRILPSTVRLVQLVNGRWKSVGADLVGEDEHLVQYTADADGFGEFAIIGTPRQQKPARASRSKVSLSRVLSTAARPFEAIAQAITYVVTGVLRWLGAIARITGRLIAHAVRAVFKNAAWTARSTGRWIARNAAIGALAILVIAAMLSFLILVPSGQQEHTVGIPAQTWQQDTQYNLDLGSYFRDPDNDVLTFTATRTSNIDITITGSKAILTPRHGWSGAERAVFIADDGKGGITKSNPVDLIVEPPVVPRNWKRIASPIFTIAVIILILVGIVVYRKQIGRMIGLRE
jgi:PGF-pre-PGF domain-containing protein